jgi:enoyl-CoA hydratase/carnithine racemase
MTLNPKSFDLAIARGVAEITLNRPERLNALTFEIYGELAETFASLETEAVRVVVITGKGRGFCSGGDVEGIIAELFERDAAGLLAFTRATGRLIQHIVELRRPVIAAVNGVAVGAGAVIAAACDLRIAAESARFGYIFPKVASERRRHGRVVLAAAHRRARARGRAALFGDIVDAPTALSMGLVNRVVATIRSWRSRARVGAPPRAGPGLRPRDDQADDRERGDAWASPPQSRPRPGPGDLHGPPRLPRGLRGQQGKTCPALLGRAG